ncbi:hypothetical protein [Paracoccus sp. pheM1]|uniref:hypothetical protein n=1 Tax=Paracoccus sp. pheM1 TaxID=2831675 RepID=UPI001BDB84B5|nr:hypothetical protein [Paracoccus sp. pheM1]MBT0782992.1 hypothetical protein [Paracoccus sp. pheM1]
MAAALGDPAAPQRQVRDWRLIMGFEATRAVFRDGGVQIPTSRATTTSPGCSSALPKASTSSMIRPAVLSKNASHSHSPNSGMRRMIGSPRPGVLPWNSSAGP